MSLNAHDPPLFFYASRYLFIVVNGWWIDVESSHASCRHANGVFTHWICLGVFTGLRELGFTFSILEQRKMFIDVFEEPYNLYIDWWATILDFI